MQFDMQPDGSVKNLPAPCVDTGMGLERLAAILQHVHSNYEIDMFDALIKAAVARDRREGPAQQLAAGDRRPHPRHFVPGERRRDPVATKAAATCSAASSAAPSATATSWARRRRSSTSWCPTWCALMGDAYPKLRADEKRIIDVLKAEEERFFETLENGMEILDAALAGGAEGAARRRGLQAARHLRLSAGPVGRRLPRARRDGRRGRLQRRDGQAEGAGPRGRQVQDGPRAGVRRRGQRVHRLREAGRAGDGRGAVRRRRGRRRAEGRPDRRRRAGHHAVLRRVGRPGRRRGPDRGPGRAGSRSTTRRRSRPTCSATTARWRRARSRWATP